MGMSRLAKDYIEYYWQRCNTVLEIYDRLLEIVESRQAIASCGGSCFACRK